MEDETMFLCGYKRTPRYGTTSSNVTGPSRPSYNKIVKHKVIPSDTLQGIALKYGSQITEIKRLNKLWSNDSIHLREILNIPVLINDDSSTTPVVGQNLSSATTYNGPVTHITSTTDSCYSSMSEGDQDANQQCSSSSVGVSPRQIHMENGAQPLAYDKSEQSVSDFLERIDSNIKLTSRNVKRLEKQSTVEKMFNNADSTLMTPSNSRQSFQDISLTRTPSPTEVRTVVAPQSRVGNNKMSKFKPQSVELQEIHDRFYQL